MPGRVDLDRLGVLAADVEDGRRPRIHHVRAEAVAQDLGADVLLRERQPRAAVAGADDVGLLELGREHAVDRRADRGGRGGGLGQRLERAIERAAQVGTHRVAVDAVLDLDDRAVEDVEQHVVAQPRFLGHRLADREVTAAGDVAEEVGLPLRARGEHLGRLLAEPPEDLGQRGGDRFDVGAEAGSFGVALAYLLEVGELFDELLAPEFALELPEESLEPAVQRPGALERAAQEREPRGHERLLLRDRGGGVVVRPRVGDAAADDVPGLVDHHRLGGGGAEVDADEAAHVMLLQCAVVRERFWLIIWK